MVGIGDTNQSINSTTQIVNGEVVRNQTLPPCDPNLISREEFDKTLKNVRIEIETQRKGFGQLQSDYAAMEQKLSQFATLVRETADAQLCTARAIEIMSDNLRTERIATSACVGGIVGGGVSWYILGPVWPVLGYATAGAIGGGVAGYITHATLPSTASMKQEATNLRRSSDKINQTVKTG